MRYVLPFCLLAATSASADITDGVVRLEVLPGWQTEAGDQMAGLRITLAPGWKTYWRAPGDAGIPPHITFSGSQNVASAAFMWPVPEVFDQNGIRSIGYRDEVVLPLQITRQSDGSIRLSGQLEIGVCEEICIPAQLPFDEDVPAGGARDPGIVAALVNRPLTADEAGVSAATCAIAQGDRGMTVTATLTMPHTGGQEAVVIEAGNPLIWVSEPDITRSGGTITATSDLVHATDDSFAIDRSALRITVLGQDQAVDIRGCAAP